MNDQTLKPRLQPKQPQVITASECTADCLLNKLQVAARLGVSPRTVDIWMAAKRLPFLKIGRTVRFRWETVIAALESYRVGRAI